MGDNSKSGHSRHIKLNVHGICLPCQSGSKDVQFYIICSFRYSISMNTTEVDPHLGSLHNGVLTPKNSELMSVLLRKEILVRLVFPKI